jgi:hypothetical protein
MHLFRWPSSRLYTASLDLTRLILLCGCRALGAGGRAGAESVAELAVDGLEVSHAAGTGGLPSHRLLAPVDCCVSVLVPVTWRWCG